MKIWVFLTDIKIYRKRGRAVTFVAFTDTWSNLCENMNSHTHSQQFCVSVVIVINTAV